MELLQKSFTNTKETFLQVGDLNIKNGAYVLTLRNAKGEIESLLINEENKTNFTAMNALKTELEAVLKELAPLASKLATEEVIDCDKQSGIETKPGTVALDNEKTLALFDELEALLDGGDVDCLGLIDQASGLNLRSIPGTDELIQQMEYLEFDLAIKSLARLKNNLG